MSPAHVLFARQGAYGHGDSAAIPRLSKAGWCRLPRRFWSSRGFFGHSAFSTSSSGSIAYRASAGESQLVWLDRSGRAVGTVGQPDDAQLALSQLSRDGRVVAVKRTIAGNTNVWLLDTERGVPRRLTFDVNDNGVILSPDGTRVVHQANGPGDGSVVYERPADGTGGETLLLDESINEWHHPQDWSADGRYILYAVTRERTWICGRCPSPANGHRSTSRGHHLQRSNGRFSPDSRWVAYQSNETGRFEIYVQPFPSPGPKVQVSVDDGTLPALAARRKRAVLPRARQTPDGGVRRQSGSRLETDPPRALFTLSTTSGYEPSLDGQRFLVTRVVSEASPITVILNWKPPAR